MEYGRAIRHLWELAEDAVFLNHGSFGACPKVVLGEQDRIRREMEREPDAFFRDRVMPREDMRTPLRAAASSLAAFIGAEPRQVAFMENATAGCEAVLRSFPLSRGDRVLITDHQYNAVRLMLEARCAETGAEPRIVGIPIPTDADAIVERIASALDPSVRLAILDHITSPTALVFPLERIIPELRRRGIRVLVDGAHAIGQIPIDMKALGADWYVSNLHKWLYAPKGTSFLYVSDDVVAMTRPNVVSHYVAMGFPHAFDYCGTRDNSGWLATPAALRFFESLDPPAARTYQSGLLAECTELMSSLGASPVCPMESCAMMRSFVLPTRGEPSAPDAPDFMRVMWHGERVQVAGHVFAGKFLLRISSQAYVDRRDLTRLRDVLERRGWPRR